MGYMLYRAIIRRIDGITEFSRRISKGDFHGSLLKQEEDEIGKLNENLNLMAEELGNKINTLTREKEILETIFNTIRDGLLVIDAKGNITITSPAVNKTLGVSENIIGRPFFEILRDPSFQDAVQEARNTGSSALKEVEIFHPTYKYLYVTATPLRSNILGAGFVLIVHDITEIKHLETVRKDFVANVSHEIRTPITAIKGFAETLLDGTLENTENARKYLEIIKKHSERLNSLVNDLLTLSKLDKNELHFSLEEISIGELIDQIFLMLEERVLSKDIKLLNEIPKDFHPITADRNSLTQIFLNLVDNAIKFTEFGRVIVRSEIIDNTTKISVEDTGIGIEAKHIPRLGERFYRADSARSRTLGGTGLGLAIVKHLVKAHSWDMKVESEQGKGTKVILIIPKS
jgi:two-component system phosphate regulon sensor histidine kinase PhoR